jgi:hypothetical protein
MDDKTITGPRDRNQLNRIKCSRSRSNAAGKIYGIEPLICKNVRHVESGNLSHRNAIIYGDSEIISGDR